MFPKSLKWIDDVYNKIESVCSHVDDFVSKEQESSKYVESLKNVGNNVKQFCSTLDPLKYVEEQLQTAGTTIEQLYSSVVPSSVDTMLSTVNNIFPIKDTDSIACKKSESNDCKADNDNSMAEPVTLVEMIAQVASAEKFENSKLDLEYDITQTDQYFDEDSSPIYDEFGIDDGSNAGFVSPGQTAEVELKDETNADDKITRSPRKVQLDESCIVIDKNDWFISQVPADIQSPKIKRPLPSSLKLRLIQRRQQMKTKSKTIISKEPSIATQQALSQPISSSNHDTWESEWEII